MSTNIFNRDDGNKSQSYAQIDQDFDNYWENEARNPVSILYSLQSSAITCKALAVYKLCTFKF